MKLPTMLLSALLLAPLCAAAQNAVTISLAEKLEQRYETHVNISAEDLAAGKTPGFDAHAEDEDGAQVLRIDGDDAGRLTGYVYVGRRVRVPDRLPPNSIARLAYQRECATANRAPSLSLYVFTRRGWDALAQNPAKSKPRRRRGRGEILWSRGIIAGREDTLEWTPWESPNLAPALRQARGQEIIVAIGMAAMHTGSAEWAKLKSPELIMSYSTPKRAARTPQYPPKEHRTLLSDEQVALARKRCAEDKAAARIRDGLVRVCKSWTERSDDEVRALIPPADAPRAFNVSIFGCPVHGKQIYKKGTYPWRLDINKPLKIICPIGGEEYPSNDYFAYMKSGFKDTSLLKGKYVDDGWGWKAPNGDLYWLVGYACHWHWCKFILPAVLRLGQAYVLTGDPAYAHKCAVMLDRIADEYPSMAYEHQSRYGYETGGRYRGKILNHIWETGTVRRLAEAYDDVFPALADAGPLEGKLAKSCKATRNNIEANILEEAIDRIKDGTISGNFGMHQCALAMAAIVRENGPVQEDLDWMLKQSGKRSASHEGVEYAFYNFVYKDGMPFETSPGYNFSWVGNFSSLARTLEKADYDFYAQPKFKAMLTAFLDLVCARRFTPAIGDAGSLISGRIGGSIPVYAAGFAHYRDARFAHALKDLGAFKRKGYAGYHALFEPNVLAEAEAAAAAQPEAPLRSRVLDGYGCGILNNDNDSVAVSMYYGYKGGHGHFDRLNFSLFAYGHKMTPDLGYPDFMNALVPGIYSWSKNTVNHNCVVVDQHRQMGNVAGQVRAFMDAPGVRFIDVSAKGTYAETSEYRRALVLIDLGPDAAYLLDLSTVDGGEQHDYSIHGPLGKCEVFGGDLSKPRKGTLAGEDVPYAYFYDDPRLADPKYRGSYGGYHGSGFQHLENVQTLAPGKWWAQWKCEGTDDVGLRLRILGQPGQELFLCDGRVSPTGKTPWVLKYLIARRKGDSGRVGRAHQRQNAVGTTHPTAMQSRYVTLLEPFKGEPQITDVERVDVANGFGVRVHRRDGQDIVVHQPQPAAVSVAGLETDATLCVARLNGDGAVRALTMLNGTYARMGGYEVKAQPSPQGEIVGIDYGKRAARLRVADGATLPTDDTLKGRPIIISNSLHSCIYTIRSVTRDGEEWVVALNEPEIMTGRGQVTGVEPDAMQIKTNSMFPSAGIYPGMRAVNEAKTVSLRVESIARGAIHLSQQPNPAGFTDANGDGVVDAWLCDFGPGDAFHIDAIASLKRQ